MATDTRYTKKQAGSLLAYGWAEWTLNENTVEAITLTGFALLPGEKCVLSLRNGSPTVDVTCYYGNSRVEGGTATTTSCTMNGTPDTITSTAHGLYLGQKVCFTGSGGGVTAFPSAFYYVVTVTDANTFQISTDRGGGAVDLSDGTNSYYLGGTHYIMGSITVEKYAAATATTMTIGQEELILEGIGDPFTVHCAKSAATAAAFNVYAELRRA